MTVIQWVSDFSERIKQLQNISLAAASGGAKELKVVATPEELGEGPREGRQLARVLALGPGGAGSQLGLLLPTEHPRVPGRPVCARGVHHCHQAVRGPGQQLVPGGALPGGERHHLAEHHAGRLQLWGHR